MTELSTLKIMRAKFNIERETLQKLFIEQDLTAKEIAKRLNCSVTTVRRYTALYGLWKFCGDEYAKRYGSRAYLDAFEGV